jgi:hypothetical protein
MSGWADLNDIDEQAPPVKRNVEDDAMWTQDPPDDDSSSSSSSESEDEQEKARNKERRARLVKAAEKILDYQVV